MRYRNGFSDLLGKLTIFNLLILLVGTIGFEPTTPCPPDKCATKLRYAPTNPVHITTTVEIIHHSI